jgi:Ribbon-helix-helix protein, copG family.
MRTKLTVTIDEDLLPRAKRHAKARGTSVSRLIEDALRAATGDEQDFVEKWRGRFTMTQRDETRFRYLKEKYGADPD